MESFAIAVKSFIVKNNKLLVIKRSENDVHKPGVWEFPGGRLDPGEEPRSGLIRETKEETGLDIEVKEPLAVKHFTRQDKQKVTMLTFLCKTKQENIILSKEHTAFEWIDLEQSKERLNDFFHQEIDNYNKYFKTISPK